MVNNVNNRKVFVGYVVSDKMNKTVVVKIDTLKKHYRYKKYIKRSKRIKIHDEYDKSSIGNKVSFVECRPLSKTKSFRLLNILE